MATIDLPQVLVLGRDSVGVVAESEGMRYYLTDCCGASATGVSGGTACRSCYQLIDPALGGLPRQPAGSQFADWSSAGPLLEVLGDGLPYDAWKAAR